ncbi:hypothetical protein [Flavobacterium sp. 25HG05S-40]|uniref:hypothetical protein n=1 Tax=Flavobacterium sp. 25HG05S-40 TaxID=3458682 RepID=UPI004044508E
MNHLKQILLLFLILGASFVFKGCETEEIYTRTRAKPVMKYISFSEFSKQGSAKQKFNEIEKKSKTSINSKLLYLPEYNFLIDTDEIIMWQYGDYKSFTFKIYRPTEIEKIENLVIVEKTESIEAYIAKYTLSDTEKQQIQNNQPVDLSGKLDLKYVSGGGCWHITHIEGQIGEDGLVYANIQYWHNSCTGEDKIVSVAIADTNNPGQSGGDSNGDSDSGNNDSGAGFFGIGFFGSGWFSAWSGNDGPGLGNIGGGSDTGSNPTWPNSGGTNGSNPTNNNPATLVLDINFVVTHPFIPSYDDIISDLTKLTEITNDTTKPYKEKITILQQSLTLDHERGFQFGEDSNQNVTGIEMPYSQTGVQFNLPQPNTTVRIHSHHNGLDPIFSAEDIRGMAEFYVVKDDSGSENAEEVISILISRTGAYATTVDDPDQVYKFYDVIKNGKTEIDGKITTNMKIYLEGYTDEVINKSRSQCNGSCTTEEYDNLLLENFLTWLKSWNTGQGYYIGTPNGDGTYTWTRIN